MSGKISPLSPSPSRGRLDAWRDRRALRAAAPVPTQAVEQYNRLLYDFLG